jgi:hypothetical protein
MDRKGEDDDYEARQAANDAAYEREYERWVASLSEAEYSEIVKNGLDKPARGYCEYTVQQPFQFRDESAIPDRPQLFSEPEPEAKSADASESVARIILHLMTCQNIALKFSRLHTSSVLLSR